MYIGGCGYIYYGGYWKLLSGELWLEALDIEVWNAFWKGCY